VKRETQKRMSKAVSGLAMAAASLFCRPARAEITLYDEGGWTFSTGGRVNGFLTYTKGGNIPQNTANPVFPGGGVEDQPDNQNNLEIFRVRTGFASTAIDFHAKRVVSESLTVKAKMGIWWAIESKRNVDQPNYPDAREGYLKLEGPWGGLLVGRTLALFPRGSIEINFLYGHGYGVGNQCNNLQGYGPSCGHVGHGVQYPGFSAGVVYNTPSLAGVTLSGGIYDPVTLPGSYERTPLPRFQGELAYDLTGSGGDNLHVFAAGLWQRLVQKGSNTAPVTILTADPWGVGFGIRGQAGIFKAGVSSHMGRGIGLWYALENTPNTVFIPTAPDMPGAYLLRSFDGYYAQTMVSPGKTDIAIGVGISRLKALAFDAGRNLLESQRGISFGVYHHIDAVTLGLDYFRGDYRWVMGDHQGVNFFNAGTSFVW
jgi:hypothetical protein